MKIHFTIDNRPASFDTDTRIIEFADGKSMSLEQYIRFNPYILPIIEEALSQEQPPSSE